MADDGQDESLFTKLAKGGYLGAGPKLAAETGRGAWMGHDEAAHAQANKEAEDSAKAHADMLKNSGAMGAWEGKK